MTMWVVRAGRGAAFLDDFQQNSLVAIGWSNLGEIAVGESRKSIIRRAQAAGTGEGNKHKLAVMAGQIWRFLNDVSTNDRVLTYDPSRRVYLLGTITSDATWSPEVIELLPRVRKVVWDGEIERDRLSTSTRNSLGAISTLFQVPTEAEQEILQVATGTPPIPETDDEAKEEDAQDLFEANREQSREAIKDRITRLDAYELQDLVAGVLRAMGYKTRVSPPGADRGIDILASPDGFGFEQPRIVVECKHRPGSSMGAQEVRSFLGGRHKDDKGLYVSTGGFSREARYEAERANIPVTLMDLDQLVEAIVDHYEQMDSETRVLLPLAKVYWPVG